MKLLRTAVAGLAGAALLGAGLAGPSAADETSDEGLLANFTFEEATGTVDGGAATAAVHGTVNLVDGPDGKAARLGRDFWLDVTNRDGSPVLAGHDAVTISYDSKPDSAGNTGWTVFAASGPGTQTYGSEHYLGYLDRTTGLTVERYANTGGRDSTGNLTSTRQNDGWKHVDVVLDGTEARLYVDQRLVTMNRAGKPLTEILGDAGGTLQLGRANWGAGEYYSGLLDNFRVYDRALTSAELGVPPAPVDLAAAVAIPSFVTDDLPAEVLGREVTWSATGEGADLVAPDGTITHPETGSAHATVTAHVDGLDDPITGEVEILAVGGAVASYVKTVTTTGGVKDDPLAYDDDRRADAWYVAARARGAEAWEPLNRSQAILYAAWAGDQGAQPNAQLGSPTPLRFADGSLGAVAAQNNATDSIYVWDSPDGATFTDQRTVRVSADGSPVSDPRIVHDAVAGVYKVFWNDPLDGGGRVATLADLDADAVPSQATQADPRQMGVTGPGLPAFAAQDEATTFSLTPQEYDTFVTNYVDLRNTGVVELDDVAVDSGQDVTAADLPATARMTYTDGSTKDLPVRWDQEQLEALDSSTPGEYVIEGAVQQTTEAMVNDARADPHLFFNDDDGYWYLTGSHYSIPSDAPDSQIHDRNAYRKIGLKRARTIEGLRDATEQIVIDPDDGTVGHEDQYPNTFYGWGGYIWAQEFHKINGTWWIVAGMNRGYAPTGGWCDNTVMIPYTGDEASFADGGFLKEENWGQPVVLEGAAFDVSYLEREEDGVTQGYWVMPRNAELWVAKATMGETGTVPLVDGAMKRIYAIHQPWEYGKSAPTPSDTNEGRDQGIVEAPFMIEHGDHVYLTYSGGTVDKYYNLGLLRAPKDADLQDPNSWTAVDFPVLDANDTADGQIGGKAHAGTGHNSFAIDDTGNLVLAYHARPYPEQHGGNGAGGLFDPDRNSWFKAVNVRANGMLDLSLSSEQEVAPENRTVRLTVVVREATPVVTVKTTTRCVAGKNVLAVTTSNNGDAPVRLTVRTPFGSREVTVPDGRSTTTSFTTRQVSVDAGEVLVSADGGDSTSTTYPAASCG